MDLSWKEIKREGPKVNFGVKLYLNRVITRHLSSWHPFQIVASNKPNPRTIFQPSHLVSSCYHHTFLFFRSAMTRWTFAAGDIEDRWNPWDDIASVRDQRSKVEGRCCFCSDKGHANLPSPFLFAAVSSSSVPGLDCVRHHFRCFMLPLFHRPSVILLLQDRCRAARWVFLHMYVCVSVCVGVWVYLG